MAKATITAARPAEDLDNKMFEELGNGIGEALKERLAKTDTAVEKTATDLAGLRKDFDEFTARPSVPRSAAQAFLRGFKAALK